MYSYEQRIKAVPLLIKYDMSYSTVIHELGYPDSKSLRGWYKEYEENGDLHKEHVRTSKYSFEQKRAAVDYYLEHGKCVNRTCKKLGYPSRPELDRWIMELAPEQKKRCRSSSSNVKYTREQKEQAIIALCSRTKTAKEVASEYGESHVKICTIGKESFLVEETRHE